MATAFGAAEKVGRRFSVVSFLPTGALVAFLALVAASGAPTGQPSLQALRRNVSQLSLTEIAVGCFAALVIALVVHPLQFGLVQLLEGYWPRRGLSGVLAEACTERHRTRRQKFDDLREEPDSSEAIGSRDAAESVWDRILRSGEQRRELANARRAEAQGLFEKLPEMDRVMPTSLGNILRYAEDFAGNRYRLDAIAVIPRLYPLMPPMMIDLLEDSRRVLDVMARFTVNFLIATVVIFVAFFGTPSWQVFALAAYGLAWISYRGCLAAAREYGETIIAAVDLYRFQLLEQMRMELPATLGAELKVNEQLMDLIQGRRYGSASGLASLRFTHPDNAGG